MKAAAQRLLILLLAGLSLPALAQSGSEGRATKQPPVSTPPGIVIDHSGASTRQYVGSPSIAILPDGSYVASHDWFGPGSTYDRMVVFRSRDKGQTWKHLAEIQGQWWSTLFAHRGALYLIGTTRENGHTVIRRSD